MITIAVTSGRKVTTYQGQLVDDPPPLDWLLRYLWGPDYPLEIRRQLYGAVSIIQCTGVDTHQVIWLDEDTMELHKRPPRGTPTRIDVHLHGMSGAEERAMEHIKPVVWSRWSQQEGET